MLVLRQRQCGVFFSNVMIIRGICLALIYHTRWESRALYNNTNSNHTHAHTCAHLDTRTPPPSTHTHAYIHTHTHTHTYMKKKERKAKAMSFIKEIYLVVSFCPILRYTGSVCMTAVQKSYKCISGSHLLSHNGIVRQVDISETRQQGATNMGSAVDV